jgi:hypothetical protein
MTLDRPIQFDNFAQPICMPCCPASSRGSIDYMVGQNLTTSGWGATKEGKLQEQKKKKNCCCKNCCNVLFFRIPQVPNSWTTF